MLPFDEINPLTARAQKKAFEAQNSITAKIAEMIALYSFMASRGDFVSASAVEKEFSRFYNKQMDTFVKDVPKIASDTVMDYSKQSYDAKADKIGISFEDNSPIHDTAIKNAEQTRNIVESISPVNTGFTETLPTGTKFTNTKDFFGRELKDGIRQVVSGNKTYGEVIRDVVGKMAKSGVRTITSPSRTERIDVITRRAIMTGIKDTITDNAYEMARQRGLTIAQISLHDGARLTHWWGGYVFSTVPTDEINPQTGEPYLTDEQLREQSGAWLSDWNCRHYLIFLDKDEKPLYNINKLREHQAKEKETKAYKGKEYIPSEAEARMRALEREMRALRADGMLHKVAYEELRKTNSAADLTDLENPYTEAKLKYRVLHAEYSDFAEHMNLKTQFERVSYDNLGRVF